MEARFEYPKRELLIIEVAASDELHKSSLKNDSINYFNLTPVPVR